MYKNLGYRPGFTAFPANLSSFQGSSVNDRQLALLEVAPLLKSKGGEEKKVILKY